MAAGTFQDRVVEFFTLREFSRQLAAVPDETRATALPALRLAFQRREAAETLWPRGSTAEALKLATSALELATSTLASFPEPHPPWLASAQAIATEAAKSNADAHLPALEDETEPGHEAIFRARIASMIAIQELATASLATPSDVRWTRNLRVAKATLAVVICVGGLTYRLHTPAFSSVTASGQYNDDNGPERAVDGDVSTGWYLPDHVATGWIDFALGKPRPVHSVHILPSNPPYNDRDVKDARIDAIEGDVIVKSIDVTFPEPNGKDPNWNDVVLDAPKCDHIHVTIKSNYKLGLGIAEMELR